MGILILFLLVRYYRSEKAPLTRGQTKYLFVGLVIYIGFGFYAFYVAQNLAVLSTSNIYPTIAPSIQIVSFAAGDFVLLLGLRKKGFYSVTPIAETATITAPLRYPLEEEAHSYLVQDPRAAFESFSELVRSGREGLMITRTYPANVRKEYGIQTTPIRWLAEERGAEGIPPEDLLGLSLTIKDFMEKAKKPVVMLHGVEYLTTINGFTPILRLIQGLIDENASKNGILIVPVTLQSLDEREQALLATETTPMPMSVSF
jgi:Protein of unknown function (DUF835)